MNDKTSFINALMGKPTMYDHLIESLDEGKPMALFQTLSRRKQNNITIPKLRRYFLRKGCSATHVEKTLNQIMRKRIYGI